MSAIVGYSNDQKLVKISLGIPEHLRKLAIFNVLDTRSKGINTLENTQILILKYLD